MGRLKPRARRPRPINVTWVEPTDLAKVAGQVLPVFRIDLDLGLDRRAFVFTITQAARDAMTADRFMQLSQQLGALVHPWQATMVVVPEQVDLQGWSVTS